MQHIEFILSYLNLIQNDILILNLDKFLKYLNR